MGIPILTDSPEQILEFFPKAPDWRHLNSRSLAAPLANLWEKISPGASVWTTDSHDRITGGGWDALAIIDQAPGSQFDALHQAASAGTALPAAVACLALRGHGFHGNRNRAWAAVKGNLHLATFHACNVPVAKVGQGFSILPTVAAARAIMGRISPDARIGIKWINDILVGGRKIAGSLTSTQVESDVYESVVTGLGMNIERTPPVETSRFVPKAACLADTLGGSGLTLPDLLPDILREFSVAYRQLVSGGHAELLRDYRDFSCCVGEQVAIWAEEVSDFASSKPLAQGRLISINDDLSLNIEGCPNPIYNGRLTFTNHSHSTTS